MKIKSILRNLKKIPLLCLLTVTIFLSDGIYDGILPWPSPFHITFAMESGTDRAPGIPVNEDRAFPAFSVDITFAGTGNDNDGSGTGTRNGNDGIGTGNENDIPGTGTRNDNDAPGTGTKNDNDAPGTEVRTDTDAGNGAPMSSDNSGAGQENSGFEQTDNTVLSDGFDAGTDPALSGMPDGGPASVSMPGDETPSDETPNDEPIVLGDDGLPLVSYIEVGDDYFDDAVFIGDSRTRSLQLYANLEHTTFLADTGLTIYTVLDKKLTPSTMNSKTTVTDYLGSHQFQKIYLMLGINELGTGTAESFCRSYGEVLDAIRALQPDAVIFLQAILHVSESKDNEHTYINNAAIIERNEALKSLADNEHIFWLDSNPAVCDENGFLIDSYTFDGVHLQAKYVYLWMDYLKQHAVKIEPAPYQPEFTPHPQAMP